MANIARYFPCEFTLVSSGLGSGIHRAAGRLAIDGMARFWSQCEDAAKARERPRL
jgi:hypothetical protein